ncbi:MAG: lysophospholipid acyltransferase family protein, partial [Acidobacteriota bacterium]
EAILIPTVLLYHRRGLRVHFLADWPMMLVPGVGYLYRRAQVIPVFGKSAKPAFMNFFRPLFDQPGTAWERAAAKLQSGGSVGVFPEGTMNRDPKRLLRGRAGAARLAVEQRVPVVPIGVRFPKHRGGEPIADGEPMALKIGSALQPPAFEAASGKAPRDLVRAFQVRIMERLSTLSGKSWEPSAPRRRFDGS